MRFARRLIIVALAASLIVATGWGLKHVDAINALFQKDGSSEHVEGVDDAHTPKPGEGRSDTATAPRPAGSPIGTTTNQEDRGTTAGNESEHPAGDDGKQADTAHERWPALQFQDASHALQIMIPIIAAVVVIDRIRRRRKTLRLPTRPVASPSNGAS